MAHLTKAIRVQILGDLDQLHKQEPRMHTNKHECSITEHTELHGKSFVFLRVLCASVVKNWAWLGQSVIPY
jgi:hypothetical protein